MLLSKRPQKGCTQSFSFLSLFSCFFFSRTLILPLISGNVHLNPDLVFPCFVCAGNVTWISWSAQCCTCSKWVNLRCLLLFFQIQCSRQLVLVQLPSLLRLCFSWGFPTIKLCDLFSFKTQRVSRNPTSTRLPLFVFPDTMLCDLIALTHY